MVGSSKCSIKSYTLLEFYSQRDYSFQPGISAGTRSLGSSWYGRASNGGSSARYRCSRGNYARIRSIHLGREERLGLLKVNRRASGGRKFFPQNRDGFREVSASAGDSIDGSADSRAVGEAPATPGPTLATNEWRGSSILEAGVSFIRGRLEKKAEYVKQALVSIEEAVAPTPYAPAQGDEAITFVLSCLALVTAFWVSNYLAPALIFGKTVFRQEEGNDNFSDTREGEGLGGTGLTSTPRTEEELMKRATNMDFSVFADARLKPLKDAADLGFKAGRRQGRKSRKTVRSDSWFNPTVWITGHDFIHVFS